MKKAFKFLNLLLISFALTGCIRLHYDFDIHNDKSMDFSMTIAMIKDADENGSTFDMDEEQIKELKEKGWSVQPYDDPEDGYEGIRLTTHIKNIDEVTSDEPFEIVLSDLASDVEGEGPSINKLFYKVDDVYYAKWVLSSEAENALENNKEADLSQIAKMLDIKVKVHLPNNAVSQNSLSDNPKELFWNLNSSNKAEFAFKIKNGLSVLTIAAIGLCLAVIGFLAYVFTKNLQMEKEEEARLKEDAEREENEKIENNNTNIDENV